MNGSIRILCVAATLVAAVGVAHASDGAEELIRRAVEARRQGDDDGAARLLREAYAAGQSPHAAGQLGLCEQALGLWAEAEIHIIATLKADDDPWVRKNRAVLVQDLKVIRSHLARLEVRGEPTGARVMINGRDVGALPLGEPVHVAAGEVDVALSAPGYAPTQRSLHLEPGEYAHLALTATATNLAPPHSAAPTDVAPKAVEPRPSIEAAVVERGAWRPRAKWIAWGVGAVALGVGIYGAIANVTGAHSFDDAGCGIDAQGRAVNSTGQLDKTCSDKKSDYESAGHLAIGAFVGAGVMGAAGAILWLTEPRVDGARLARTTCRPAVGSGIEAGLACSVRF